MSFDVIGRIVASDQIDWKSSPLIYKVSGSRVSRVRKPRLLDSMITSPIFVSIDPRASLSVNETLRIGAQMAVRSRVSFRLTASAGEAEQKRLASFIANSNSPSLDLLRAIEESIQLSDDHVELVLEGKTIPPAAWREVLRRTSNLGMAVDQDSLELAAVPWLGDTIDPKLSIDRTGGVSVSSSDGMGKVDLMWKCRLVPAVLGKAERSHQPVYSPAWYRNKTPLQVADASDGPHIEAIVERHVYDLLDHSFSEHQLRTDISSVEGAVSASLSEFVMNRFGLDCNFSLFAKSSNAEILLHSGTVDLEYPLSGTDKNLILKITVEYSYEIDNIAKHDSSPVKSDVVGFVNESSIEILKSHLLQLPFEDKVSLLIHDRVAEKALGDGLQSDLVQLLEPHGVRIRSEIATIKSALITSLTESALTVRSGERKYPLSRLTYEPTFEMTFGVALRDRTAAAKLATHLSDQLTLNETLAAAARNVIRTVFSSTTPNEYLAATSGRLNSLPQRLEEQLRDVLASEFGLELARNPAYQYSDDELNQRLNAIAARPFSIDWEGDVISSRDGSKVPVTCTIQGTIKGMAHDGNFTKWSQENEELWTNFWNIAQKYSVDEQIEQFTNFVRNDLDVLVSSMQAEHFLMTDRRVWAPSIRAIVEDRAYKCALELSIDDHDVNVRLSDQYRRSLTEDSTRLERLLQRRAEIQTELDDMRFSSPAQTTRQSSRWSSDKKGAAASDQNRIKSLKRLLNEISQEIDQERSKLNTAVEPLSLPPGSTGDKGEGSGQ